MNNPYSIIESFINTYERGSQAVTNGFEGETTQNKIENFAKDLGGMVLGGMLNKLGRPNKYALASLISGAPVGCWHLTIGNPRSPIIEVGNLVCTGSEIEHYGPLGLDDFPTGIRVKINLEHGKPRDIMGIEQMYGRGDCRIYSPLGNEVMSMYKLSEPVKISRPSGTGMLQTSLDEMLLPHTQQTKKKQDIEIKDAEEFEIKYLKRYFGTLDESMIASAGGESLYGSENNKNKHVAK
jgi:hypothetical protein